MLCPTSPHLALLALLSVAGAVGPGEPCSSEMNLIKDQLQVNCSGQGLTVVPLALPRNTGIVLLSANHLESVSTASFKHLQKLEELDLSGNRLSELHTGSLLPLLQELVLSHNALQALPILQGLPALTCLTLAHNNISELLPGAFQDVGQLKELNLRGNLLRTLPEEAFKGLAKLKDLDLSDNALEELPQGLLAELELDTLRLSGNQLRTLPSDFFPEEHIFPFVFLAGNPWRCNCGLAYLRDWIKGNEDSIYIQEQRSDRLLTEKNPLSPVCDAPLRHRGSPILEYNETCNEAGVTDSHIDGIMAEGTPVPSTTVPSSTLPTTSPMPPTTPPSTTLPPTITTPPTTLPTITPIPPTTAPSTTLPPTITAPPTTLPTTTPVPPTTAPSTTLTPTTAPELASPAPPRLPSTPMTPTTTLISLPPFHTSPLHITLCHQPPPPTGDPRLCMCPTPPPEMPVTGRQQGRDGPQWGHWVLAHCCLLHLMLYLASLLLLLLPMLALMGWMGWVYLGWYRPALRGPPEARLMRYQLLRKGERAAPLMMYISSFKIPAVPPTFRTTKELRIHRDPPVTSFRRVTRRLLSVGGLGPWRAPSAYSLDRGEAAIGAVRVKYANTTL